jgi:hypothetical protein
MDMSQRSKERRKYEMLRRFGASHEVAVLKLARGNWNPYGGASSTSTPTAERLAEVESNVG